MTLSARHLLTLALLTTAAPTFAQTTLAQAPTPPASAPTASAPVSNAPSGTLTVKGDTGRTATLTLADIAALPRETVKAASGHGGPSRSYEGARLVDVLRSVGAPLGARLHGPPATNLVIFTGTDGYRSVMALADADPDSHPPARVIIADRAEGQPLNAKEGPLRLVIDGDLRSTRSVHGLARVEIRRLP